MTKYIVFATKYFEIHIDADTEEDALEEALDISLSEWDDEHEMDVHVEKLVNSNEEGK